MKKISKLICLSIIGLATLQSCDKESNTPIPPEPTHDPIIVTPTTIDQVNPTELEALRAFAQLNGLEKDFASNKPKEWSDDNLLISWTKVDEEKYVISAIKSGKKGNMSVTKLVLKDAEKNLPHLEVIELNTPKLEALELANLPKLHKLTLTGSTTAMLEKAGLDILPMLDSLYLAQFPKLKTTIQSDDSFKLSEGYDQVAEKVISMQPKLKYINLSQTGIVNLYIKGEEIPVDDVILNKNNDLDLIYIYNANMKNTSFSGKEFPALHSLTLKNIHMKNDGVIKIEDMKKLSTLYIQKGEGIKSIKVNNTPELKEVSLNDLSLNKSPKITKADKLKNIDLSKNNLSSVDFSALRALKKITLTSNDFTSTDDIKLGDQLQVFVAADNPKLTKADLTPYKKLKFITIPRSNLSELNIEGLTSLSVINVVSNHLKSVKLGNTEFSELESIDISNNELDIRNIALIAKAVVPSIDKEYLTEADDFKLLPQKGFTLPKPVDGILNYSEMNNAFKAAGFTEKTFIFEIMFQEDYDIMVDAKNGIIKFYEEGPFFLYIKVRGNSNELAFVEKELLTVETPATKD